MAGRWTAVALGAVVGACQTPDPEPQVPPRVATDGSIDAPAPGAGPADEALTPIDWTRGGDCLGQLRLLQQVALEGRLKRGHEPPFAVVASMPKTSLDWVEAPQVPIVSDLPLESSNRASPATVEAPCVLEVRPAEDLQSAHRIVSLEEVVSAYQSGSRREKNPQYEAAAARVREAKGEGRKKPGVMRVGDPLLDLVGVVVGGVIEAFGQVGSAYDLRRAKAELESTPRSLEQPIYRSYSFERAMVRAGKEATIPVALHDRARGGIWRAELRQREMRELAILDGLDARDRDYDQHRAGSMSWAEFEHWQQQPPQLPLTALVDALVDTDPGSMVAATNSNPAPSVRTEDPAMEAATDALPEPGSPIGDAADDLLATSSAGAVAEARRPVMEAGASVSRRNGARGDDARIESVVRIEAEGRRGGGFYVEPNVVVTTADVVGSASVLDVTTRSGGGVLGLVVHADPIRNLALVHLPRPGTPGVLYDGGAIAPEQPVEILALGGGATSRRLRAVLHGSHVVVDGGADAPRGAPIFLDGRVIALIADRGREGRHTVLRVDRFYDLLDPAALAALP